jgi:hypothetical protein
MGYKVKEADDGKFNVFGEGDETPLNKNPYDDKADADAFVAALEKKASEKDEPSEKSGARHSSNDMKHIQGIHDGSIALGADCVGETSKSFKDFAMSVARYGMDAAAYAVHESWDIQTASHALAAVVGLISSEICEPDDVKSLCDIARGIVEFISGEIEDMEKAGTASAEESQDDTSNVVNYGGEKKVEWHALTLTPATLNVTPAREPAQLKSTNSLDLRYVKALNIDTLPDLAVKYVGRDTILHPVFLWGDQKTVDLDIEFFTSTSDFWDEALGKSARPLTWDHGQDELFNSIEPNPVIGKTVKYHDDEVGRWAESVITADGKYRKFIDKFIDEKRLGYSSDSAPQYVQREKQGKAVWLKRWPWFGGSLTATPCEPRMKQFAPDFIKSLGIVVPDAPQAWASEAEQQRRSIQIMKMKLEQGA